MFTREDFDFKTLHYRSHDNNSRLKFAFLLKKNEINRCIIPTPLRCTVLVFETTSAASAFVSGTERVGSAGACNALKKAAPQSVDSGCSSITVMFDSVINRWASCSPSWNG